MFAIATQFITIFQIFIPTPTDKSSSQPSSSKFLFETEVIKKSDNQQKCRVGEPSPNWYIYNTAPAPKARIIAEEGPREQEAFCETVSPENVREVITMKLTTIVA